MVIEWQKLRVQPERYRRFLEKDREIWTAGLAREEGFLGKETWLGEDGEVVLVIRWQSRQHWEEISKDRLADLDRRFREAMPEGWERSELRSYEVV